MNVVDIELFGQEFTLRQGEQVATGEGPNERTWRRWLFEDENGFQIALLRDMASGIWAAYVNYESQKPPRRFNFWSEENEGPDGAIKSLQASMVISAQVLSNLLRGKKPN